jgi:hypothetical protein
VPFADMTPRAQKIINRIDPHRRPFAPGSALATSAGAKANSFVMQGHASGAWVAIFRNDCEALTTPNHTPAPEVQVSTSEVPCNFVGEFKVGDNLRYNCRILGAMAAANGDEVLNKMIVLQVGAILEAALI